MCYYSAALKNTRTAVEGESVILASLPSHAPGHIVKGFVSPSQPAVGVCLCTGSRLLLRDLPVNLGLGDEAEAIFLEGNSPDGFQEDQLVFPQRAIALRGLPPGIRADILPKNTSFKTLALQVEQAVSAPELIPVLAR